MGVTDDEFEAALKDTTERAKEHIVKRNNSIKNGDIAAETRADSAIASILSTTAHSLPTSPSKSDNDQRLAAKQELARASEVFRKPADPANRPAKEMVIGKLSPFLIATKLTILLGAVAVGLVATPAVLTMADGMQVDGNFLNNADGTTTKFFNENGVGPVDHQQTVHTATAEVIIPDHSIGFSDTVQNLWDIVSEFF